MDQTLAAYDDFGKIHGRFPDWNGGRAGSRFTIHGRHYTARPYASTTRRGSSALSRVITCNVPVFVRAPTSAGRIDG